MKGGGLKFHIRILKALTHNARNWRPRYVMFYNSMNILKLVVLVIFQH